MINHITIVAGARPNFMKIAPIIHELDRTSISYNLVHTGQHYDKKMSQDFFDQLEIPSPKINLQVGSGTQAEQTAAIMIGFENFLLNNPTDLVLVVGDVTSTMACAIVAKKLHILVAHVEAGIRSYDKSMPEEINRIITDSITDYFFTTSTLADTTLMTHGIHPHNIFFVGNTMIDTLLKNRHKFIKPKFWNSLNLNSKEYIVVTLHRPSNVDTASQLELILTEILSNSNNLPIIFPVHPRTAKVINTLNLPYDNLHMVEPMSYLEFNYLVENSKLVITDSGGITEETTVMRVPCMTLRDNTERPETITYGTNELVGTDPTFIKSYMDKLFTGDWKSGSSPPLWDGNAATRIIIVIKNL
jgi:UDP-N-acetylglucosamine 2-epimerase (non-hydrolysing)